MSKSINIFSYVILLFQEIYNSFFKKSSALFYKKVLIAALFVTISFISICIFSALLKNNVEAKNDDILHKYYTVVSVDEGDTLWKYAEEYCVLGYEDYAEYISEVKSINHLNNIDELISGQTIVLPYYSTEILQ